jgi:hypothetical protein
MDCEDETSARHSVCFAKALSGSVVLTARILRFPAWKSSLRSMQTVNPCVWLSASKATRTMALDAQYERFEGLVLMVVYGAVPIRRRPFTGPSVEVEASELSTVESPDLLVHPLVKSSS